MPSELDKYKTDIIAILLSARKSDPWTRERIAAELKIPHISEDEIKNLKNYIKDLRRTAEAGESLTVIGNDGKGYYFPEFEDEAEKLSLKMVKIGTGFYRSGQKFEAHRKNCKKRPNDQITIDDLGVVDY